MAREFTLQKTQKERQPTRADAYTTAAVAWNLEKANHSISHRWNGLSNSLGYHAGRLAKQRSSENPGFWLLA
ncbi:uncharacterized protein N7473_004574 [Penicillium subrubescens]|jgi:hypothetical protein|uniref:Uncharacterized protein n=1 Tax=Penicillium subrubescens TaxID=1316194 RepID=A0A1Q5TQK5_9EURO|nr:uncharacterized protein N7473_004574 [Penicillium subrubescens]KAJ5900504.1 hypothetical protein N7473_004574 [Penicillium subrubescens]OKP02504.1 hypothetical protein PENSUB_7037 [Penicillium subrubescens]